MWRLPITPWMLDTFSCPLDSWLRPGWAGLDMATWPLIGWWRLMGPVEASWPSLSCLEQFGPLGSLAYPWKHWTCAGVHFDDFEHFERFGYSEHFYHFYCFHTVQFYSSWHHIGHQICHRASKSFPARVLGKENYYLTRIHTLNCCSKQIIHYIFPHQFNCHSGFKIHK